MSVVLTLRYHDSEPGGGICKDDADAKAEAAKVAREVLNDLADEDELFMAFDKVSCDREAVPGAAAGPIPTDVDQLTDDEALDIAADLMEFEWDTLPGEPEREPANVEVVEASADLAPSPFVVKWNDGYAAQCNTREQADWLAGVLRLALAGLPVPAPEPTGPTPEVVIAAGVRCALAVIGAWESGDLAATVRELAEWTRDTRKDFPKLDLEGAGDDEVSLCVLDIVPGDRVDLEGAPGCDGEAFVPGVEFEYARVIGAERESDDCMRLDFENYPSVGFEAWIDLKVIKGLPDDRLFYDAAGADE